MAHRTAARARLALALFTVFGLFSSLASVSAVTADGQPGLLFRYSADHGFNADFARGEREPNFADKVKVVPNGHLGPALSAADDQVLSWQAPGNIQAQRGTLSFFWRAREPVGKSPFPIFRVGYGDHSSWDMVWLRIDWNGHGFDAFVTDNNLARTRVSWTTTLVPSPDEWTHLAFTWDETLGIRLYVGGVLCASRNATMVLDATLDQFGPHSRIISPHQVQSAYQYLRGGDIDEIRIYDHQLGDVGVAALAHDSLPDAAPAPVRDFSAPAWRNEWWFRYGWNRPADPPPYLADAATRIRKVEFVDARDLKERMTNGNDGIAETTWPGVYNRSRLAGRHDYFELPDWNVYVEGGKSITYTVAAEPWNRLEFQGAAYGPLTFLPGTGAPRKLAERPPGQERTVHSFPELSGGKLRFDNIVQETPIQELAAYAVTPGAEPGDERTLYYKIAATADPAEYPSADELVRFIAGRYVADERATVVALPAGAPAKSRPDGGELRLMPLVHVLIPGDFRQTRPAGPVGHYSYGWENMDAGLDGIALDLPALRVKPTHGGLFPLNIQIKDPLWPARNLLDVSVSVKPGEARTLWLDTRDRLLPPGHSLYMTIAGAGQDFSAAQLEGAALRLKFKPRAQALPEHIADRFRQARDNQAFLVEEYDNTRRLARFERLDRELTDLLRVDPDNVHGREFWAELNPEQGWPDRTLQAPPAGVPVWAFRQVESLRRVRQYVNWWIDNRQVPYGDFGGGISDDDDLTHQWPALGLMGSDPDKLRHSVDALVDAVYNNHMITNGLGTIQTDELHSYEEGINAKSEAMYLSYGDPKTVERLMETARNYGRIVETNSKGHTHIVSSLYSGTDVVREGGWGWSKPYSYLILHPGVLLADYNGNPTLRKLIVALADSHLAHGRQDAAGTWSFPEEINSTTEEARGVLIAKSRGNVAIMQLFWAAYRWTGDAKYLRPLLSEVARGDFGSVAEINANLVDLLDKRASWGAALQKSADEERPDERAAGRENQGAAFADFAAWQASGDLKYLEKLYGEQIVTANNRMYMVTESHWWSDRVELFSDLLQRSRLGGMALRRNQFVPGHLVSWRFADVDGAQKLAMLVRGTASQGAMSTRFKVVAYNLDDEPLAATMTGWDVAPGRWRIAQGVDGGAAEARSVDFERTRGVDLVFPPHATTVLEFQLETAGKPLWERPDLGIGAADVRVAKGAVRVTVHSLGSVGTSAATVVLQDASGRELARATVPALAAPLDLVPKTVDVELRRPGGIATSGLRVRVVGPADVPEITMLNNEVVLP